jgi:hypothetical protein
MASGRASEFKNDTREPTGTCTSRGERPEELIVMVVSVEGDDGLELPQLRPTRPRVIPSDRCKR